MTCIVAISDGNTVWMGADSAGSNGYTLQIRKDPKIYEVGEFLFGFTSSFRMGQILGHKFNPPSHPEEMSNYGYMVGLFIDALRGTLKDLGYARNISGEDHGGVFLVGYRGDIFRIESDYQVAQSIHSYNSVGCGEDIAFGALYALNNIEIKPSKKLKLALSAAESFSAGVRGPFSIVFKTYDDV